MRNKEILKENVQDVHSQIENQYPFSMQMSPAVSHENLKNLISIFWCLFHKHFEREAESSDFYQELLSIMKDFEKDSSLINPIENHLMPLAYDYVFLGSRMGNQMIITRNPIVLESDYAAFFKVGFPAQRWRCTIQELDELSSQELQKLSKDVAHIFQGLIDLGKSLES